MKTWIIFLLILLVGLQYQLWFSNGGIASVLDLKKELEMQLINNKNLFQKNQALEAQVNELKRGEQALEEKARNDLGMLGMDEVFYQVID